MATQGARGAAFWSEMLEAGEGLVGARWEGHVNARALRAFCAELERAARLCGEVRVLVDARGVTGYDPDAHAQARAWAQSRGGACVLALAVVCDSQLAAIESPATALAPRRARFFAAPDAALRYLEQRVPARSGMYARPDVDSRREPA